MEIETNNTTSFADDSTSDEISQLTQRLKSCVNLESIRSEFQWILENELKESSKVRFI